MTEKLKGMRGSLAVLAVSVAELRQASMFDKAQKADVCLAQTLDLLGHLVNSIEQLERQQHGKN